MKSSMRFTRDAMATYEWFQGQLSVRHICHGITAFCCCRNPSHADIPVGSNGGGMGNLQREGQQIVREKPHGSLHMRLNSSLSRAKPGTCLG